MNPHLKRKIRKLISPFRRVGLKNLDFSIISNNCWGGVIYDIFGLQYRTPTIGCFMYSKDYIKFISNLSYYLSIDAVKIENSESKYKDKLNKETPIGKIDDVEVIFLHYSNIDDALSKWNKRRKRVNFDNLLIKYSDQNEFSYNEYIEYKNLKFKNKIFITANSDLKEEDVIYLPQFQNIGYAKDVIKPSFKYIKIKKMLNDLKR